MKKDGFTLVELLAVIALIAILAIIVLPNVLSTLKKSKQQLFVTNYQTLYKSVESYIIKEQLNNSNTPVTKVFSNKCYGGTQLEGYNTDFNYYVLIDNGNIKRININNDDFIIMLSKDNIKIEDIKIEDVNEYHEDDSICPIIIM